MEFIKSLCLGGITTTMLLSGCTQKNITLEGKVTNTSGAPIVYNITTDGIYLPNKIDTLRLNADSTYQIKIEPAKNENGQFFDMLMAEELDSKNLDNAGFDGQISFGEDAFYQKYEQKIKLLTDKFMPPKDEDEHLRAQKRKEMEQYADYRNYLSFSMFEQVTDEHGNVIRENFVDDMAGRDSGGEGQNPKLSWYCWMRRFPKWIRSGAQSV